MVAKMPGFPPGCQTVGVGGVGEGGVRGNTMPWSSTRGLMGMSMGAERGMMSMLEGLVKIMVDWCVSNCVLLE
jgi:hypothetical protein